MLSSPIKPILTSFLMVIGLVSLAYGQPQQQGRDSRPDFDPRRWLENLDKNKNGKLDPEELTGRAREFAAPKLKELGFNPDAPISIKKISTAVDKARAAKNAPPPSVPGFGIQPEMSLVPGFDTELGSALAGIGTLEERYDPRVLQRLQQTLDRYDKNKDGILDQREISEAKWIYGDPTKNDLNKDGILTKTELAERYLTREKYEKDERKKAEDRLSDLYKKPEEWKKRWERANGDEKRRMGDYWKKQYDKLEDEGARQRARAAFGLGGRDSKGESSSKGDPRRRSSSSSQRSSSQRSSGEGDDANKQRRVYLHNSVRDKLEAQGVSGGFIDKDSNGDGQLQMSEYETRWTSRKLADFEKLDTNGDGVISPQEWLGSED